METIIKVIKGYNPFFPTQNELYFEGSDLGDFLEVIGYFITLYRNKKIQS